MKLTCRQADLARGLAAVSHAVAASSSLPILAHILLATDEGRLKLAATNLEIAVTYWVTAQIEEVGTTTVPARLFTEFVARLEGETLTLEVAAGMHVLHLRDERSSAHFRGMDATEFPCIPGAEGSEGSLSLVAAVLKEAIDQVTFAAAVDETRPALTAVLLEVRPGCMTFAAADAFRLAVRSVDLEGVSDLEGLDLLVPARALKELGRILPAEGAVEMIATPSRNQVLFHTPQLDLVSRLIDANFPNYRQIVPKTHATRAVVATREVAGDAKRAALFAQERSNVMCLTIEPGEGSGTPGSLGVQAEAEDLGDNENRLNADVCGPGMQLTMNVRYLVDVLSVIGTPEVAVEASTPNQPILIRPVGGDSSHFVIMPMVFNR